MRLPKFLSTAVLVTFFSVLYTHQQTDIFYLAYMCQKNQVSMEDLLDKNGILRYNIGKDASLVRLGNKVAQTADFHIPDNYRLVRLTPPKEAPGNIANTNKESIALRLFGIKRQAEAKTINRSTLFPAFNSARSEGNLVKPKQDISKE